MNQSYRDHQAAAAAFAHVMESESLRTYLSRHGFFTTDSPDEEHSMLITIDREPALDFFAAISSCMRLPAYIAVHRPRRRPWGFAFLLVDKVIDRPSEPLGATTSVGMLYDAAASLETPLTITGSDCANCTHSFRIRALP